MTAGTEIFISGGRFRVSAGATYERGQVLKDSLRVLMGRFADQDARPWMDPPWKIHLWCWTAPRMHPAARAVL